MKSIRFFLLILFSFAIILTGCTRENKHKDIQPLPEIHFPEENQEIPDEEPDPYVKSESEKVVEAFVESIKDETKYYDIFDAKTYAFMMTLKRDFPEKNNIKHYLLNSKIEKIDERKMKITRKDNNESYYFEFKDNIWKLNGWEPIMENKDDYKDHSIYQELENFNKLEKRYLSFIESCIHYCQDLEATLFDSLEGNTIGGCPQYLYSHLEKAFLTSNKLELEDFDTVFELLTHILRTNNEDYVYDEFFTESTARILKESPLNPSKEKLIEIIQNIENITNIDDETFAFTSHYFLEEMQPALVMEDHIRIHLRAKDLLDEETMKRDEIRLNAARELTVALEQIRFDYIEAGYPKTLEEFITIVQENEYLDVFPEDPLCHINALYCFKYTSNNGTDFRLELTLEHPFNANRMKEDGGTSDELYEIYSP